MSAPIRLQPLGDSIKKDWDTNIIDFKGYNGSPNLKKSGIKVGFTQDMVDEWIRCRDDPIYFAETYIKIVHVDRGLIPIELYEYQKEVIDVVQGNRKIIVTQSRQSGKALCLDTEIPMSAGGFKRMGDIVVGDSVIGNDGKPAMVTFVSEIHNKPSYRITFSDGSTIKACEDHLWEVNNNQVLSTKELAKNIQTSRFFIPATAPVEYPQIELDFDPYFLGQFVIDVNTPIPDEYLYSSIDDRVALLRGILCSHEYIYRNKGVLEFSLPQENDVIHQIKQLIESLGIVVCIHKKYTRKIDVIHTVISFSEHELLKFSNPLWNIQKKVRYITKVERIDNIPTKCISVNNKNHMFLCGRQYIPTHNTTVATCIILHYILFNQHKTVALLANKGDAALEIMSRIQLAYEYLPKWLQSGIITWNKGSIELENGCKILASATSGSAIRGKSCSLVYIDECAFVEHFDEFYSSVYPTIASGKDTKILFTSTPNGLNFFYKFWTEAKEERNGFKWVEVAWDKVPGRDDAWKIETLSGMNHDYEQFEVEFNCQFAGSSGTLLSGSSLKALVHQTPIYEWEGFTQYHEPIKEEAYVMLCDVSRGKGLDYSAFQVINVTKMPYVQVATFRSNTITPTDYAHVINKIGTLYNTASVLVENNDIGGQVADMLFDDLDYENLLFTESNGKAGKVLCGGGSKAEPSIRTTTSVKAKGCSVLKLLIEQQQLIINDFNTINELSRFSKKGKSYEAEDGHDDMVMGLVLFAWITTQPYFSNITDVNTLSNLRDNNTQWDECIPFGFIVDGREDDNLVEIDDSGNAWMKTDAWHMNY